MKYLYLFIILSFVFVTADAHKPHHNSYPDFDYHHHKDSSHSPLFYLVCSPFYVLKYVTQGMFVGVCDASGWLTVGSALFVGAGLKGMYQRRNMDKLVDQERNAFLDDPKKVAVAGAVAFVGFGLLHLFTKSNSCNKGIVIMP